MSFQGVVFAAALLAVSSLAVPAARADCRIFAASGAVMENVGDVYRAGDLRVRISKASDSRLSVDLKAPDFQTKDIEFKLGEPRTFSVCGSEITVTFLAARGGAWRLHLSVF